MEWDLSKIYKTLDDFYKDLSILEKGIDGLEGCQEKFGYDSFVSLSDSSVLYEQLHAYISLHQSKNQEEAQINEAMRKLVPFKTRLDNLFDRIINNDELLDQIALEPTLKGYHREVQRRRSCYAGDDVESLLNDMRISGSLNWLDCHKKNIQTSRTALGNSFADIRKMQQSDDWREREKGASENIELSILTSDIASRALFSIKSENAFSSAAHGYSSVLEERLDSEGIDEVLFDTSFQAIGKLLPSLRQSLEKRLCAVEPGAPHWVNFGYIDTSSLPSIDFNEAVSLICSAASLIDKAFEQLIHTTVEERLIDSDFLSGKRTGAFCNNVYGRKLTYLSLTYTGSLNSFVSLAHEFGHCIHHSLLNKLPYLTTDVSISIKEGFAQFFEDLSLGVLLERHPKFTQSALDKKVMSLQNSFLNVYSRFLFERDLFTLCERKVQPSAESINTLNKEAQMFVFGESSNRLVNPFSWVNTPHYFYINRPFYNYPYIIGRLLSYQLSYCMREDRAAIDCFLEALAEGATNSINGLLSIFQRDSVDLWAQATREISDYLDSYSSS